MSAHISHAAGAARSNAGFLQKPIAGDDSSDGNDARAPFKSSHVSQVAAAEE